VEWGWSRGRGWWKQEGSRTGFFSEKVKKWGKIVKNNAIFSKI
jgi:hypothetical protein